MLKISIITVSYNAAATIEQAISSVVNQTYENIEYIMIDGGSTDGTVDIIRKYEDRIAYWVSEPDEGIYAAMNKGIDAATGDYVYFLGADDALMNTEVIQRVVKHMEKNICELYCFSVYMVNESNQEKIIMPECKSNKSKYPGMPPHQGMFAMRSVIKEKKFDVKYKIVADYKFFVECYLANDIHVNYSAVPVAYFSVEGLSGSNEKNMADETRHLFYEIYQEYADNPSIGYRYYIKEVLKRLKLLGIMKKLRNSRGWRKHHCKNAICRWCGRK